MVVRHDLCKNYDFFMSCVLAHITFASAFYSDVLMSPMFISYCSSLTYLMQDVGLG